MISQHLRLRNSARGVQDDVRTFVNPNIWYLVPHLVFGSYLVLGRDGRDIESTIGVQATQFIHVFQDDDLAEVNIRLKSILWGRVGTVTVSLLIWLVINILEFYSFCTR